MQTLTREKDPYANNVNESSSSLNQDTSLNTIPVNLDNYQNKQ